MDYTYAGTAYTAQWQADTYTLTYNLNEGTMPEGQASSQKITIETSLSSLPQPSRTGYTFAGWFTDPAFTEETQKTEISGATEDITLYAKWDVINYTITYIVTGSPTTIDTYTIESETITLPVPAETEGYSFEGWFTNPAFADGTKVEQIPQGSTGNITLYAKMTETSSGITITTPDVSFITAFIKPEGDEFNALTSTYTSIQFELQSFSPSGQMGTDRTYKWYLDGELKSTAQTYMLNIKTDDSVTAGTHILTFIVTDSNNKIATGTKQFVIIK